MGRPRFSLIVGSTTRQNKVYKSRTSATMAEPVAKRTRSSRPNLGVELIGRVATFASLGDELRKICLAVGPNDARTVRSSYLLNNDSYLHSILHLRQRRSVIIPKIRAWMSVNTDWKRRVTDGNIEKYRTTGFVAEESGRYRLDHPNIIFNNPAVAIVLGLADVLEYLVEEKNIIVNGYFWREYPERKLHLVAVAIYFDLPSLKYLLTVDGLDLDNPAWEERQDIRLVHLVTGYESFDIIDSQTFLTFIRHPSVILNDDRHIMPLCDMLADLYHRDKIPDFFDVWTARFKVLLEEGADPNRPDRSGISALERARGYSEVVLIDKPDRCNMWREVLELLENASGDNAS